MANRKYREPKDLPDEEADVLNPFGPRSNKGDIEPRHYKEMRNASYQLFHALIREHPEIIQTLTKQQAERRTLSCVY